MRLLLPESIARPAGSVCAVGRLGVLPRFPARTVPKEGYRPGGIGFGRPLDFVIGGQRESGDLDHRTPKGEISAAMYSISKFNLAIWETTS